MARSLKKAASMRSFKLGLVVVLLGWVSGCNCEDCVPTLGVALPDLPVASSQAVSIELRPADGDDKSVITCSPTLDAANKPAWTCSSMQQAASTGKQFEFRNVNVQGDWLVHLQGPTGAIDVTRKPNDTDPGEGWPTSCTPCYSHDIHITTDDLSQVGIKS